MISSSWAIPTITNTRNVRPVDLAIVAHAVCLFIVAIDSLCRGYSPAINDAALWRDAEAREGLSVRLQRRHLCKNQLKASC
jgi:hypothetical protein